MSTAKFGIDCIHCLRSTVNVVAHDNRIHQQTHGAQIGFNGYSPSLSFDFIEPRTRWCVGCVSTINGGNKHVDIKEVFHKS